MVNWLRKAVAPEVRDVFSIKVSGRRGIRLGTSLKKPFGTSSQPDGRRQRHLAGQARRIQAMMAVQPPKSGHRSLFFCGDDDLFWTTYDGDITSQLVRPRRSIWTPFPNWTPRKAN